jgi:uncharacterized protein YraI
MHRLWRPDVIIEILVLVGLGMPPEIVMAHGAASAGTYVTTARVEIKAGPDERHESLRSFRKGTTFQIVGEEGRWLKVKIAEHEDRYGYIDRRFAVVKDPHSAELTLVTRRLALLLEAGLTVEQCLDALIEQAQSEASGRILRAVRTEVRSGRSLAAAFERFPASFPEIYRALVGTGEQSDDLAGVMSRLADHLEGRPVMSQSAGLDARVHPRPAIPGTYLTTNEVDARLGPGTDHPIFSTIPKGTKIIIVEREGEWLRIATRRGQPPAYVERRSTFLQPSD